MTQQTPNSDEGDPEAHVRISYGGLSSQFFEHWPARADTPRGRVVLVHGGWWRDLHDLSLMHDLCRTLVAEQWEVFNLEFRRTGGDGGGWPTSVVDVREALDAINKIAVPGDGPVVLVGHSAGAHLAMLSWQSLDLALLVALAPVTDLRESGELGLGEGAVADFLGAAWEQTAEEASPVHHLPLRVQQLLVHGTDDVRVPVGQSRTYAHAAASAGEQVELVEIVGGDHFCVIDPGTTGCRTWIHRIAGLVPAPSNANAAAP